MTVWTPDLLITSGRGVIVTGGDGGADCDEAAVMVTAAGELTRVIYVRSVNYAWRKYGGGGDGGDDGEEELWW